MTTEGFRRKLTAILSADVEGYSRLMGEDEEATVRTLTAHREVMSTLIEKHLGRVVDSPGDNVLAEFASVVDAVRSAVEIQEELKARNAELQENRRMAFRIGINLGDVVEEGDRIYGDGVNITARVEGLAEGGGICISGTVYDSIKNKLSLSYEPLGEHTVKNIAEPVRVYRMRIGPEAAAAMVRKEKERPRRWQKGALAAVVVLLVAAGAWAIWNFYFRPPPIEPASVEKMAFPLPDKPSIAVLPFDNLSGDPKEDYFSEGITEEITTALSMIPDLFVIDRHSTDTYKDKAVKIQQVAEELGVRYVLEGSVRKSGDRVRITAQLIDALQGHHLWAQRYDRELKEIFALQDEITIKVVTALELKLTKREEDIYARGTDNLEAYLKVMKMKHHLNNWTPKSAEITRKLGEEALALDPNYSVAYRLLAGSHISDFWYGTSKSRRKSLERSVELLRKAIELDDTHAQAHALLGYSYAIMRQYDKGIAVGNRGLELEPSSAYVVRCNAQIFLWAGRYKEAIALFKQGIRLNPKPVSLYLNLGVALRCPGQYEESIAVLKKAIKLKPNDIFGHVVLASSYALAGREEEARETAKEVLRINPKFSFERFFGRTTPLKDKAHLKLVIEALRKAGLK